MSSRDDECVFRILGPVQVRSGSGTIAFGRRQQRDLLALLLLRAEQVISVAYIVEAMWGLEMPRTGAAQVKNMMSALRGCLADDSGPLASVRWESSGYRLELHRGQLDLAVFTGLVARARGSPPAEAVTLLRRALGLWDGRQALAGVRAVYADAERARLEEQRLDALELLFDAELACCGHTRVIAELMDAVTHHPARERLVAQLMTALHRSGRTSDALAAYQRARRVLVDEFGLEPGAALRELEHRILCADPSLTVPASAATQRLPVPAQLPLDVRGFTGRAKEIAVLDGLIQPPAPPTVIISALMGSAGIGKTALAVHWAHRVAHRFPDGQLYVNLRGFDPDVAPMSPADAIRGFLDALAVTPARIPGDLQAQAGLYRSLLAGRKMLVVLDNAVCTDQVRPLLPGTPGCLVVVTSRNQLTGLIATEGAHPVTLDLLTPVDAKQMLIARLGGERIAADEAAARRIADRCARLPLALAVVAAHAAIHPALPLATMAEQLTDTGFVHPDSGNDVHSVFSWSYDRLDADSARLFRWLGLHHGPEITTSASASLIGGDPSAARRLLATLTGAHLLNEREPGRFAMHDLLSAYAAAKSVEVDAPDARHAAVGRLLGHYLHTADLAAGHLYPHRYRITPAPLSPGVTVEAIGDREQALAWFGRERRNLLAAVAQAASAGFCEPAWQLAIAFGVFAGRQGHWHDWIDSLRLALAAAERLGDTLGQAHAHSVLGQAHNRLRSFGEAHGHLDRALTLFTALGDQLGLAYTRLRLSAVHDGLGRPAEALAQSRLAHELYRTACHAPGLAQSLNNLGWYQAQLGRHQDAIEHCREALALHRKLGDLHGAAHTLDSLGYIYQRLGDFGVAARHYREAGLILREAGDRTNEASALEHLGDAHHAAGQTGPARAAWAEALRVLEELGHLEAGRVRAKLHV